MPDGSRTIGFPRRASAAVSAGEVTLPFDRSPPLSARVHSLVRPVLFGVCSPASLRRFLVQRSPAMGFVPSSRRYRSCLLIADNPIVPLCSALRFSQPLDGFFHARVRGLLSSRSHVQGFRSGVCSRSAAVPTRRRSVPPCRCRARAHRLPGCHAFTPRLRGFTPRGDAYIEVGV